MDTPDQGSPPEVKKRQLNVANWPKSDKTVH